MGALISFLLYKRKNDCYACTDRSTRHCCHFCNLDFCSECVLSHDDGHLSPPQKRSFAKILTTSIIRHKFLASFTEESWSVVKVPIGGTRQSDCRTFKNIQYSWSLVKLTTPSVDEVKRRRQYQQVGPLRAIVGKTNHRAFVL